MKITHNETGQQYHLSPDTELEIERTNPFFNEWGEQSLPVDLPNTDQNRQLTGFPNLLGNKSKASQRILSKIEDGEYVMQCRQAILGASKDETISTSFYMNEGAFYDSLPDTNLKTIFGSETIPGITTVAAAIAFCKSLLTTNDERFTIFPVLIKSDDSSVTYKWINRIGYLDSSGVAYTSDPPKYPGDPGLGTYTLRFYGEFNYSEKVGDVTVTTPIGYYMSPFIKANYVLKRIFQYFGYTLADNFFTTTDPFVNMVFINNTLDAIIQGTIKLADLVPNCLCSDILNVFRKKFCCEFIPDEVNKSVRIVLFNDIIGSVSSVDLTKALTSKLSVEYPDTYKQLSLSSDDSISDSDSESFDSVADMLSSYPSAYLEHIDQCFYRDGFAAGTYTKDKVASCSMPYQEKELLEIQDVSVPDCVPAVVKTTIKSYGAVSWLSGNYEYDYLPVLYIGDGNRLNSKIEYNSVADESFYSLKTVSSSKSQSPILAFSYSAGNGYMIGTLSNCNYHGLKMWNYSLCYNGPCGIFERFYRTFDSLLRNSLHTVKGELLLTNDQKRTIPAHEKIIIKGQELLINSLKYKLGGSNDPDRKSVV